MTACARPGCAGQLDEDGFCDTCGLAAVAVPVPAGTGQAAARPATEPVTAGSARTSGSASAATVSTAWTSAGTTPLTGTSRRGSGRSSNRGLLGAGLVEVPRVPYRDPRTAVLANPEVPEDKRYCSSCGVKVGRGRDGRPSRVEGFCPKCGHRFSFTPKLSAGEELHGQYEVLGCLAHGGLGWIYLALDHAVADRWVVLKGLLDTGDADAMAAAVAERQFLAEVEHPNIVKIHNFVQHRHPGSDEATGYIVMEYVGGRSLKEMIKERRRELGPRECLPLAQAIAYALEVLPAIGYLHSVGLLYCDFKPDNVIQTEEQLKLIDLGAVRRGDDEVSAVYGTVGYQAPEIASAGPSVESDIYTVGRALAVMSFPFDFHSSTFRDRLPSPGEVPLLAAHDSYYRLLLRATATDPAHRFGSAEEMKDQLTGVLREVLAAEDAVPRPGLSAEFTPERHDFGIRGGPLDPRVVLDALPMPRVDGADPAAAFLATVTGDDPRRLLAELADAPQSTVEVRLRTVRALLELGDLAAANRELHSLPAELWVDWRVDWHRGLAALAAGRPDEARDSFDAVYSAVPGEAAPKLALAASAELAGDLAAADHYYRVVWRTDRAHLSAGFGLARVLLARGERAEAVDVLRSVPDSSVHYLTAQLAAIQAQTANAPVEALTEQDLVTASTRLAVLEMDAERRALASRELLEAALGWVRTGRTGTGQVLDCELSEPELRLGLERCYRILARLAVTSAERIALVDRANEIRPRTWV